MKKKLLYIALAVFCAFAVLGCGSDAPQEPEKTTYTIHYEPGADAQISATSQTVEYGKEFKLLTPTLTDRVFFGWVEKGSGEPFADGVYERKSDVTLTAVWKQALKITLDVSADVTVDTKEITVCDGMSYTLPSPQKSGLTFVTWLTSDAAAVPITGTFRGSSDVTYTAVWKRTDNEPMYSVIYDLGEVDAQISAEKTGVDYGMPYTLLRPTRDGYAFIGWRLKGTDTAFADGTFSFGWDVTVEAVWELDEWTEIL